MTLVPFVVILLGLGWGIGQVANAFEYRRNQLIVGVALVTLVALGVVLLRMKVTPCPGFE